MSARGTTDVPYAGLLVAGGCPRAGARVKVRNPALPREVVGIVADADADSADVEAAVLAAQAAGRSWATPLAERAARLHDATARLGEHSAERAVLYVRENGKTLAEAKREVSGLPSRLRLVLGWTHMLADEPVAARPASSCAPGLMALPRASRRSTHRSPRPCRRPSARCSQATRSLLSRRRPAP